MAEGIPDADILILREVVDGFDFSAADLFEFVVDVEFLFEKVKGQCLGEIVLKVFQGNLFSKIVIAELGQKFV